jgi:hypothetical protein
LLLLQLLHQSVCILLDLDALLTHVLARRCTGTSTSTSTSTSSTSTGPSVLAQ